MLLHCSVLVALSPYSGGGAAAAIFFVAFRLVQVLRQQGLILDDLQYKVMRQNPKSEGVRAAAPPSAAPAGDAESVGSEDSERDRSPHSKVSPPAAAAAAAARHPRLLPLTGKEKGTYESYFGVCCWPPTPPYSSSSNSCCCNGSNVGCAAAAAGQSSCPAAEAGCPTCASSWLGPRLARRIDIKIYPQHMRAPALLYFTGCAIFNRSSRAWAKRLGYSLDDTGLYAVLRAPAGAPKEKHIWGFVPCETEEDIFEALGLVFVPPHKREGPAQPKPETLITGAP